MHPYLQVILWAAGIVVLFIILMAWNNHKWKKAQKNRIKRIFGKIPEREYSPDDLERISHYFRRKENGKFYIDDITWIWIGFLYRSIRRFHHLEKTCSIICFEDLFSTKKNWKNVRN